ncbi:MAG: hypothetical protein AAGH76_14950 [Pseudomonadota bacterium]
MKRPSPEVKHWKTVEVQLRQAACLLTDPAKFTVEERDFDEYVDCIDTGEFEDALDELSALAHQIGCKSGLWRRLKKPAIQLGLTEKADEYEEHFRKALRENT